MSLGEAELEPEGVEYVVVRVAQCMVLSVSHGAQESRCLD